MASVTSQHRGRRVVAVRPTRRGSTSSPCSCCWSACVAGGAARRLRSEPAAGAIVVGVVARADRGAVAAGRQAVGAGGRPAAGPVHGPARAGAVLDHPVHRPGLVVDRPADHHHQLRRRGDAHLRHGAGERRRRPLLDGLRPREGRARGPGLQARGELGGADGAPRHHRPHAADRPAPGPRADRGRAPEADRRAVEPLGRDGPVGRDARRDHPESLQDAMSREAQASREKEARIILGQAEVEIAHLFDQAAAVVRATTRRPCTCGR